MTSETESDGRWLTYAEIAAELGKTVAAAQQHVRRRKWKRQQSNHPHDLARFWVSAEALGTYVVPTGKPLPLPTRDPSEELLGRAWDQLFQDLEQSRASIRALENELANVRQDKARLEAREKEREAWGLRRRIAWALLRREA